MAWTTKPLGGGVKSLVVRPLKKNTFFYVCLPLVIGCNKGSKYESLYLLYN